MAVKRVPLYVSLVFSPYCAAFLNISCPDAVFPADYHNQVNFNVSMNWTSPEDIEIFTFWFEGICLLGNITDYNISYKDPVIIACRNNYYYRSMSFMVNFFGLQNRTSYHNSTVVAPGTVCLFRGGYVSHIPTTVWKVFPSDSCGVPALQSTGEHHIMNV